jgi:biotin carboxylase
MMNAAHPIAIYYEHPDWFRPLFSELDRRQIPYTRINAREHSYDPSGGNGKCSLWFNRMSPSAYLRGVGQAIFYTLSLLEHLEATGVRVVNGQRAFRTEISKALQLSLLSSNRLPHPKTRVINHPTQAPEAVRELRFPVIVKPNIGGSGAGVTRFNTQQALASAVAEGRLELGMDQTALVQEFIPARADHITRIEVLGGKFLYAIRIYFSGENYNLCPADICQTTDGVELLRESCLVEAAKNSLRVEACTPPLEVIHAAERLMAAAGIEVGGIEYIVDDRDGRLYYYDINALSNFVADPVQVVGFDPFACLVDYLEREATR